MKNCYSDFEKILKHYGYSFNDVFTENSYTIDMKDFIKVLGYRNKLSKKQFTTGIWLEVKGLPLTNQLIKIDIKAHKTE